ncbi:adenosylcobinamide-phosphate synthase CbiB [Pelotomaculum isophthalicicum JI]|uniref:Cobalamin biosynthesis protein CobD n=1 Tax=Pelotomaculum isophthalicicum JI TaxID=947010 RepID=A0A9X4H621_9FIRM|nr:adenosylcobinamide-phosphate synthase CbiB [Pelotomaculum isophthalicicum]MDF9408852.1 adenosylcobinamide-phosphate synthase CbiB [Pelotomaculum isophthalicicum JI]
MFLNLPIFLGAIALDLVIGDPRWIPHPTRMIGWLIARLEDLFRPMAVTPRGQLIAGATLVTLVAGSSWLLTYLMLVLAIRWAPVAGVCLGIWLFSTTVAWRGLAEAGLEIYRLLKNDKLAEARRQTGLIVGRDTGELPPGEVARAVVETVAENASDAIIAPLFWGLVGGAPLAMAYRAINTLDSMLGYRSEQYLYFGRAAARLDDLANYLPARLTGLLICLAAAVTGTGFFRAWTTMRRDARSHPSPNSGFPEAAAAGSMGVRLGGLNYYRGIASFRPYIGELCEEITPGHIVKSVKLISVATLLFTATVSVILWFLTELSVWGGSN